MPAIKTLKLLAHGDNYQPISNGQSSHPLTRVSSLNTHQNSTGKTLSQSRSLRLLSSKATENQSDHSEKATNHSEQAQPETEDGSS